MTLYHLEKFEDRTGALSYTFPLQMYQWESQQGLALPSSAVVGASYSYDHYNYSVAPKMDALETVRFVNLRSSASALETDLDSLRAVMYRAGRGKLFTIDSAGNRRWCWARVSDMPAFTFSPGQFRHLPVAISFKRMSDWYDTTQTSVTSALITVSGTTFTVTNSGNAVVKNAIISLLSKNATGFTNPVLLNQTNGYQVSSTRDGTSINDILKIDAGAASIQYSSNNGATYADDYALATIGAAQVGLMNLEPGSNQFKYTDGATPNLQVKVEFYPAFH